MWVRRLLPGAGDQDLLWFHAGSLTEPCGHLERCAARITPQDAQFARHRLQLPEHALERRLTRPSIKIHPEDVLPVAHLARSRFKFAHIHASRRKLLQNRKQRPRLIPYAHQEGGARRTCARAQFSGAPLGAQHPEAGAVPWISLNAARKLHQTVQLRRTRREDGGRIALTSFTD